jgi:proteasome lid subunit RPN8/RPN11
LERSSETLIQLAGDRSPRCEECWVLVGERRGSIWLGRLLDRVVGKPATVEFDGPGVLAREEQLSDVIGFLHTHPDCEANLSQRDIHTMQAWTSAFGKPLLCLIEGTDGLRAYLFENSDSKGNPVHIERFTNDWLAAIESR